jgi:hypothetical protein
MANPLTEALELDRHPAVAAVAVAAPSWFMPDQLAPHENQRTAARLGKRL